MEKAKEERGQAEWYYVVHLDIEIIKMSRVGRVQQKPKSQVSMICPTNYKISLFKLPF